MKIKRGFTLVELLVVIAVISIIVGVVIPRFKGMQDEANKSKVKAELTTLQTGVESYSMNHEQHEYPPTTATICQDSLNGANPVIVSSVLYDPFGGSGEEYIYELSPSGAYYVIFSRGPDLVRDIAGVGDDGYLTGDHVDDIFVTNGYGWTP